MQDEVPIFGDKMGPLSPALLLSSERVLFPSTIAILTAECYPSVVLLLAALSFFLCAITIFNGHIATRHKVSLMEAIIPIQ